MPDIKAKTILVKAKLVTKEQVDEAEKLQQTEGGHIVDICVKLGFIAEVSYLRALADDFKVPFVELEQINVHPDLIRKIPEKVARRHKCVVLEIINRDTLLLGIVDPNNIMAIDEITRLLGCKIKMAVVREKELTRTLDLEYRRTNEIINFADELKQGFAEEDVNNIDEDLTEQHHDAPVAKLLDSILEDAIHVGASDIHLEPDENKLTIRQRVDGVLYKSVTYDKKITAPLVLRIKLIAKLNISEKRLPQDGRFNITLESRKIAIRVSSMPVKHGESVVMRLLYQGVDMLKIRQIGMKEPLVKKLRQLITKPHGMILVSGPTGSGKTTTLYACLNELNEETKKIITIEDPIEYTLPGINQVQVQSNIGLTFASVLRASLRQDPDIVMVGEMRDEETVQIGLRAAMTGHLVLSTIHTNDSISSVFRLTDMGAEEYLVSSAVRAIIAQRLVRKICDNCITDYTPTNLEENFLKALTKSDVINMQFKAGKGCSHCNNSGYNGRIGIHELLEITPEIITGMSKDDYSACMVAAKKQPAFCTLSESALQLVKAGKTSINELLRITSELDI